MTQSLYTRTEAGFSPADDDGRKYWNRFSPGELVMLNFTLPRSIQQHRLYWALVSIACENTDGFFRSKDEASDSIKLACGLSSITHIKFRGEVFERKTPTSIAFGNMDQTEFGNFFDKAMTYVCSELCPGLDPQTLRIEIGHTP